MSNRFKTFTGGVLDTNCFLYESPSGNILFDAPQGADEAFKNARIDLLVITHGHFDHVGSAAAIARRHGCPITFHAETLPMVSDPEFFRRWGFELEIEPFKADFLIDESPEVNLAGTVVQTFYVPGHCPGSLCFLLPEEKTLIAGDVLFREGVGRWDLPGGNGPLLFEGIQTKLFPLPDDIVVFPGHGPTTTIGHEKRENPYVRG